MIGKGSVHQHYAFPVISRVILYFENKNQSLSTSPRKRDFWHKYSFRGFISSQDIHLFRICENTLATQYKQVPKDAIISGAQYRLGTEALN